MSENPDQTEERADSPTKPLVTDGGASSDGPSDEPPEAVLDTVENSLTDDGFDVFRGRQFISIRASGQLAPNSTVAEEHLQDAAAVMLAYNDSNNDIAVIPLEQDYDKPNVFSLNSGSPPTISAREFMRAHQLTPEETARYTPEWDDTIGGDSIDGGLRVDLDQEPEEPPAAGSDDTDIK